MKISKYYSRIGEQYIKPLGQSKSLLNFPQPTSFKEFSPQKVPFSFSVFDHVL